MSHRPDLPTQISKCTLCAERFATTQTAHAPRPVVWFQPNAPILIAGQAPGARVHECGVPFRDASGERLRDWLGLSEADFYDRAKVAIVPMAFCFPGYNAAGSDLPPPPICAKTWRHQTLLYIGRPKLTLLIGGHAMRYHLNPKAKVTQSVANWRDHAPDIFPLPHPSWRNTAWIKRHTWFEDELLPHLRQTITDVLHDDDRAG